MELLQLKPCTSWVSVSSHHSYVDILKGYHCSTLSKVIRYTLILTNITFKVGECIDTAKCSL